MTASRSTRIDDAVGRDRIRHAYLLTGGAGSGKTECALRFAESGLARGERVGMLVHGSARQISAQAAHLGIDLKSGIRDGRLLLLRYRPDFARRAAHAASTDEAIGDLRQQFIEHRPTRVVIDTVAPLLDDGSASAIPATSLVELLESTESTALLTYSSDVGASYDRRLEPLVQAAAGVLRLVRASDGDVRVEIVSLRHAPAELPEPIGAMRQRLAAGRRRAHLARPPLAVHEDETLT